MYLVPGGVPSLGGVPGLGGCTWSWGVYLVLGGVPGPGGGCTWSGTPPVNRMTNRCKNITLPQTSFAGGNNVCFSLVRQDVHTPQINALSLLNGNGITYSRRFMWMFLKAIAAPYLGIVNPVINISKCLPVISAENLE